MTDAKDPIIFWFDFSSPYSYLASELIDDLAAKHGRKVKWRPMMLGAAFKASNMPLLITIPLKGEYSKRDFDRSARYLGIPYKFPPKFPIATLAAARGYYWLHGQDCAKAREYAHAVFRAYWVDSRDISELPVVLEIVDRLGIDRDAFAAAIATPEIKDRLKQETDAAIAKGMFGAPYIVVDGEPFWGADRLPQIDKWLATGGF
ncbi:MAG: 2-hydroxychromene-2-carboxylate isomerase [Sulfuritalea sp.]|nr:2-hydroxychromene-2-carboxylate isomerase [Sulfuritalea sp.]